VWDSAVYIRTRALISKTSPKSHLLSEAFLCDCNNLKTPSGFSTAAPEIKGQGHPFSEYPQLVPPWLTIPEVDRQKVEGPLRTGTSRRGETTPAATLALV